jgi:large subunit ribosomal protein L24
LELEGKAMRKIKRDDEVVVITGRDKGKRGKVIKVLEKDRLLVSGIQLVKKHQRPNPQAGVPGGIIEKEAPIQISNVAIYNSATEKADRVGFKILEDGKKVRVFKSNGEVIDA